MDYILFLFENELYYELSYYDFLRYSNTGYMLGRYTSMTHFLLL